MRMTLTALPITSAGRFSPLGPRGIAPAQFRLDSLYFRKQIGLLAFLATIEGMSKGRTQRDLHSLQFSPQLVIRKLGEVHLRLRAFCQA